MELTKKQTFLFRRERNVNCAADNISIAMPKEALLQTRNLTKKYKDYCAVNDVSMTINKGDIYGFIGKNGAGKTTFIRMITKLIKPTSGTFEFIDGQKNIKLGAVIEAPAFYPYLSAEDNLMYFAVQINLLDKKNRVAEVLKFVGLDKVGKKCFKDFSLGMKQRLGLGLAILNKPDLLVLDEPTNGLDPQGIVEIRNMIKQLNTEYQTTILVSSHILSELSMLATRYGIIHQGQLIKEITTAELENECQANILLNSSNNQRALELLRSNGYNVVQDKELLKISSNSSIMDSIAKLLFQDGMYLKYFGYKEESLEDYYLKLTNI